MNRRSFFLLALAVARFRPTLALAAKNVSRAVFTDITANSKIRFKHEASTTTQKYLPESMGAGVAMFDYNNDGYLDLL